MQIAASEFKARCLGLMDEVSRTGEALVITKHGQPVARLLPAQTDEPPLLGRLRGSVRIAGDIEAPLGEAWSADA
ncbi:MAG: type II toxin-antitoxin system Phd/YefM family antitoxin [Rhodocyclaceae bacterium]|nr:type II toxin-antitoxin system Phd/YefM family antitoxin [Rhodocyclaceae bacterium]